MTLFRHFSKNFFLPFLKKKFNLIYHQNFRDDLFCFFLVTDLFRPSTVGFLHRGPKPMAQIDLGGVKNLKFRKIYTTLIILSSSMGGPNSIAIFEGAMAGLAPSRIRH